MVHCSIIIPHYNSTESLTKLLNTIPNTPKIQVIVIDDHSTLKYKEQLFIIQKENLNKNVVFYSNTNGKKGAGACRNLGLKIAKGDWLLFADSDDYFLGDFFNVISRFFNTDYDVVFFPPTSEEKGTQKKSDRHLSYARLVDEQLNYNNRISEVQLRYLYLVPWSKLIKKKVVDEYGIMFDEVIAANDVMFSVKLGNSMNKFYVSDKVIYCVTRSKGSLTTIVNEDIYDSRAYIYIKYYKYLKDNLTKDEFKLIKHKISGRGILLKSFNFGYKKMISMFIEMKRNGIHILDIKYFNPFFTMKKLLSFMKNNRKQKKWELREKNKSEI